MNRPYDFGIFDPYVRYKVIPLIPEIRGQIIEDAQTCEPADIKMLMERLYRLGRDCAISGSLTLPEDSLRPTITEDLDILHADAYLCSIFSLLGYFQEASVGLVECSRIIRKLFVTDVDYLVLSPAREIKHLQTVGWRSMSSLASEFDYSGVPDFPQRLMSYIAAKRLRGDWRPYHHIGATELSDLQALEDLQFRRSDHYINLWRDTAHNVKHTLEKRNFMGLHHL